MWRWGTGRGGRVGLEAPVVASTRQAWDSRWRAASRWSWSWRAASASSTRTSPGCRTGRGSSNFLFIRLPFDKMFPDVRTGHTFARYMRALLCPTCTRMPRSPSRRRLRTCTCTTTRDLGSFFVASKFEMFLWELV
ncbi:uncharacterized protein [Aegilops tauschii subsp. strangulata]|uniref:uncharacterized protein n=1 Tax=Aegilops tauschii subsp. strangulata TaxID=200361 RepID=UPI001ABC5C77|nr:uncharacterized protein LOC120973263 [Aegilops tauschii subsp. strangulata]XP_040254614.1 uncharacterized protein LOC120973263 [Aegilops tauschii subsp. strangulata]XP_044331895.1 uncharacterized protein LOC123052654 [Triticum aestivum]XP_045088893.1 uncharacterized protein LOC120973263 [Aegilops tauschii subsp. strangulata]